LFRAAMTMRSADGTAMPGTRVEIREPSKSAILYTVQDGRAGYKMGRLDELKFVQAQGGERAKKAGSIERLW
jgi:hypothetical protein